MSFPQIDKKILKSIENELASIFSHIERYKNSGEIEDFIKKYNSNFFDLLSITNQEEFNSIKSRDGYEFMADNDSDQYDFNNQDERSLFIFKQTISITLLAIVLLYKKGFLNQMSNNPVSFIRKILESILPYHSRFKDISNENDLRDFIREHMNEIKPELWNHLVQLAYSDIRILLWSRFDTINQQPLEHFGFEHIITKPNEGLKKHIDDLNLNLVSESKPGEYTEYFMSLDEELQSHYIVPDVFLIDTSLIGDYKKKGIIFPVQSYKKRDELEKTFVDKKILEIGKSTNGIIDTYPISRNFHLPAQVSSSEKSDLFKHQDFSLGALIKLTDDVRKSYTSPNDKKTKARIHTLCTENINEINIKSDQKYLDFLFPFNQSESWPIPMQLGRGAHAVYTFFAYTANLFNVRNSFLEIRETNPLKLSVYKGIELKNRLKDFLKITYTYVPIHSLALDQITSGKLRDIEKKWFDPCLPIEAVKYQNKNIIFNETPLYIRDNKPLSCIGGFNLAICNHSSNINSSATILDNISKDYFWEPIRNNKLTNDFICRIEKYAGDDYDNLRKSFEDLLKSQNNQYSYFKIPSHIAKRPNISGWTNLEMIISDSIRVHVLALMIFRLFATIELDMDDILDDSDSGKKISKQNTVNIFENFSKLISVYFKDKLSFDDKDEWIENNFNCFKSEKVYIAEMVNDLINTYNKSTENPENDVMKLIAENLSDNLINKINSYCVFNNIKLEYID